MFVNPEDLSTAVEILEAARKELTSRNKLSELDTKLSDTLFDVVAILGERPFKQYSDISSACRNYVELRDQLSIERKAWEDHEAAVKGEMDKISMWLRDRGDELGVDSFNSPYGTAYRNIKTSYRVEKWDDYSAWMLRTGNIHCVEKRPAKLAVKEVYEQTGELPPGLLEFVEVEFNVRRPNKPRAKS